jgi:hypothetical protein
MDTNDKNGNVDDSTTIHDEGNIILIEQSVCIHDIMAIAAEAGYELTEKDARDFVEFEGDRIESVASSVLYGLLVGEVNQHIEFLENMEATPPPATGPQLVSKLVQ